MENPDLGHPLHPNFGVRVPFGTFNPIPQIIKFCICVCVFMYVCVYVCVYMWGRDPLRERALKEYLGESKEGMCIFVKGLDFLGICFGASREVESLLPASEREGLIGRLGGSDQ